MRRFEGGVVAHLGAIASLLVAFAMLSAAGAAYASTALWVVNQDSDTVGEFAGKALKKSGANNPSRVLASTALAGPWGLIFDARRISG